MVTKTALAPISERAMARSRQVREPRNPVFLAFAKVGGGWVKIGACWPFRSGSEGYSLQITALPLQWDGKFILILPDKPEEQFPQDDGMSRP